MSVLIVENLYKSFGSVHVTQDVSLSVAEAECHALIGPNGAGKTTLIHQISGVLQPDSGHIRFDGHDVTALPVWRRVQAGLSRTFQITSVIPSFSVLENVALAVQGKQGSSLRFIKSASGEKELNDAAMVSVNQIGLADRAEIPQKICRMANGDCWSWALHWRASRRSFCWMNRWQGLDVPKAKLSQKSCWNCVVTFQCCWLNTIWTRFFGWPMSFRYWLTV